MTEKIWAEIVSNRSLEDFENELNGRLSQFQDDGYTIKNVEYNVTATGPNNATLYSALILYY